MKKALLALAICAGALSACADETPNAPQPVEQPGDGGDTDDGPPQFEQPN